MQLLVGALSALPLVAQAPAASDTTRKNQTLFTVKDLALAGGFVGLTFAMFPADKSIALRLQNENSKANKFFDHAATGVELIASPGAYIIGPAIYAYGRLTHHPDIADFGWHGTESAVIATGITGILKGALGRSRPFVTNDTNPRDFKFGKGYSGENRSSFPSGHTTVAFAVASSVTSEARRLWPGHTNIVAPVMYGGATLVGLSRMYHNKHWASDVALGAGIGTFSGLKVVRYSHAHPDNFVDRLLLSTSAMPDGHGGGVMSWSFEVP